MSNTIKRVIFFSKFAFLTVLASALGIRFIITSFYRNAKEQNQRYKDGKSYCDGYKKRSKHQDWLAIDIAVIEHGICIWERNHDYEKLGKIWKLLGGIWGGDWQLNDVYHFAYGENLNE